VLLARHQELCQFVGVDGPNLGAPLGSREFVHALAASPRLEAGVDLDLAVLDGLGKRGANQPHPILAEAVLRFVARWSRIMEQIASARAALFGQAHVVGSKRNPMSLRYYLDHSMQMTTATGREMTSHYVATRVAEFRDLAGSPRRRAGWLRTALDACDEPAVFVVRDSAPEVATRSALLPHIAGGRFVAYGPCGARQPEAPR
jgi:hypothetical protein